MFILAVTDGVTLNAPTVGLSTGWVLVILGLTMLLRGNLHTSKAWEAREADHRREIQAAEDAHARELERVDHDRQEWRTESRIKDAQMVEKDTQLAEKDVQLRHLGEVGRTVEALLSALKDLAAGGSR